MHYILYIYIICSICLYILYLETKYSKCYFYKDKNNIQCALGKEIA